MNSVPCTKIPCAQCPFRKDTQKGWLGGERMADILEQDSFTCHKTSDPNRLQCAGHMIIKGNENAFVNLANQLRIDLGLRGQELIFETKQECINHHGNG
jgi:Family of unknown function (DUF6283)